MSVATVFSMEHLQRISNTNQSGRYSSKAIVISSLARTSLVQRGRAAFMMLFGTPFLWPCE